MWGTDSGVLMEMIVGEVRGLLCGCFLLYRVEVTGRPQRPGLIERRSKSRVYPGGYVALILIDGFMPASKTGASGIIVRCV